MLVPEDDVAMDVIADRLHALAPVAELPNRPHATCEQIGFAVAAAEQEHQAFVGKIRHVMLLRCEDRRIGLAVVVHHPGCRQPQPARGPTMRLHQLPKPSR